MESPYSPSSKPLHNFELPELWNKNGQSSVTKRRRSIKSPRLKTSSSSAALLTHLQAPPPPNSHLVPVTPQMKTSAAALLTHLQAFPPNSHPVTPHMKTSSAAALLIHLGPPPPNSHVVPVTPPCSQLFVSSPPTIPLPHRSPAHIDFLMKQDLSSKSSHKGKYLKNSLANGIDDLEKPSFLLEEALLHFQRQASLESETWMSLESKALMREKGKGVMIEYAIHHSKKSTSSKLKINEARSEKKLQKKFKETEDGELGKKKSKILIKIPSKVKIPNKNIKEQGENSKDRVLKTKKGEESNELRKVIKFIDEFDDFDYDTKIWDLRPRKQKLKFHKSVGDEKGIIFKSPEKINKAQLQIRSANKSDGLKDKKGEWGASSGEKKEKVGGERNEKVGGSGVDKGEKCGGDKKGKSVVTDAKKEKGGGNAGERKEKGGGCGSEKKERSAENKEKDEVRKEKKEKKEKIDDKKVEKQEKSVKEKKKLSIAIPLTKQEIDEDIYALTGSKPSRRPKKRNKNMQKQLDVVFPGLWLASISSDTYKVSAESSKKKNH